MYLVKVEISSCDDGRMMRWAIKKQEAVLENDPEGSQTKNK